MTAFHIQIDGRPISVTSGQTVLEAARLLGLDIPTLCYLEKCGPLTSCLVCLVKINGKLVPSCGTKVQPGMEVESETNEVHEARRTALELLFSEHVGDCLAPCHRLCPLEMNIPTLLRQIGAGKLDDAARTIRDALPLAGVLGRLCHHPCEQGCRRGAWDDPASIRDLERWVTDRHAEITPAQVSPSAKSVAIVGSGPAGLAAAWYLARQGHACTVVDRHDQAGGSLRDSIHANLLPAEVLHAEVRLLERLGVEFRLGVALGREVTLEGLLRGFAAVLLATGQRCSAEGAAFGVAVTSAGLRAHPDTYETSHPAVFAAGRAIKPVTLLVRAMADGRAAAECIHQYLAGNMIERRAKPFSSVMGRLDARELRSFINHGAESCELCHPGPLHPTAASETPAPNQNAPCRFGGTHGVVSPCDTCGGHSAQEAAIEASRCLHCDCRSSGHCALQFYAERYGADPGRYRAQRPQFEQVRRPGGLIFEPGKCIRCGICVRLTELAAEPLGLTFIGRGFDVQLGAPLDRTLEEGMQKTAAECVRECPTGALAFA